MADFDAIYEDNSVDAAAAPMAPGSASGSVLEEEVDAAYSPPPALVPDPVLVRGAGNITV